MMKSKNPIGNLLSYEMNYDIHMFGVAMEDMISCHIHGTDVVTQK